MKWVKIGDPDGHHTPDELLSFVYYKDQDAIDKAFDTGTPDSPHLWVKHPFEKPLSIATQEDYEIFCGGYLFFYDLIVRSNSIDHQIYFDWSEKDVIPFTVSIYISPKPGRGKKNSAPEKDQQMMRALGDGDDPTGELIDPPPPPPPPPPPRD